MNALFRPTISFEEYTVLMKQPATLNMMQLHLNRWVITNSIRVVGAALLIKNFPTRVLENQHGTLEAQLITASNNFVTRWEAGCNGEHVPELRQRHHEFMQVFYQWKPQDEEVLVARIRRALRALYEARPIAPNPDIIDKDIEQLRIKMKVVGGDQALIDFDNNTPMVAAATDARVVPITRPSNNQMAYELLIDEKYQLLDNPHDMKKIFQEAFWNSLIDDLQFQPPVYTRALRVVNEIVDGVNDLRSTLMVPRMEVLEWPQCQECGNKLYHHLLELALPSRRREFEQKWRGFEAEFKAESLVQNLRMLLGFVNKIRLDEANLRIKIIAPTIKVHGVEFLHRKFKERLDANQVTLDNTNTWLRATTWALPRPYVMADIHNIAIMALVTKKPETIPETLELDKERLQEWHQEFHYQARAVAFVHSIKYQFADAPIDTISKYFAEHDEPDMIGYALYAVGERLTKTVLHRALKKIVEEYDNTLYQVVTQRLRSYWLKILSGEPIPANKTLLGMAGRVFDRAQKVKHVCELNRAIYGQWYNEILADH